MSGDRSPPARPVLVIGYGNTLRGDDGVGQHVADAVARWGLPGVQTLAVHQLTPELTELLAAAGLAVFVDAYAAHGEGAVSVQPLEPAGSPAALGHTSDPRFLLGLVQALYGRHPLAWWVTVPGVNFEPGEGLSPTAQCGMGAALRQIAALVQGVPKENCPCTKPE